MNLTHLDPFSSEVLHSHGLGDEEEVRDAVDKLSVDLFRHGFVKRSETGLNVGHRDRQLAGHDRRGKRGIHVTHDEHHVRFHLLTDALERDHDRAGHRPVATGADSKIPLGPGKTELIEEILAAVLDWDVRFSDLMNLGRQCLLTERDFNRRAGFTAAQDRLPSFIYTEKLSPNDSVFDVPEADLEAFYNY